MPSLTESRRVEAYHRARLAGLAADMEAGRLLDKDKVEDATFRLARDLRDQLLGLPSRIAPALTGMNDLAEIIQFLDLEIRTALTEISAGLTVSPSAKRRPHSRRVAVRRPKVMAPTVPRAPRV